MAAISVFVAVSITEMWPFVDDLLGKVEMVCAKTDIDIAREYVRHLGGDLKLLEQLVSEYQRAVEALLLIRGHRQLLDDIPVLQSAIALITPSGVLAEMHRSKAEPGSGSK